MSRTAIREKSYWTFKVSNGKTYLRPPKDICNHVVAFVNNYPEETLMIDPKSIFSPRVSNKRVCGIFLSYRGLRRREGKIFHGYRIFSWSCIETHNERAKVEEIIKVPAILCLRSCFCPTYVESTIQIRWSRNPLFFTKLSIISCIIQTAYIFIYIIDNQIFFPT